MLQSWKTRIRNNVALAHEAGTNATLRVLRDALGRPGGIDNFDAIAQYSSDACEKLAKATSEDAMRKIAYKEIEAVSHAGGKTFFSPKLNLEQKQLFQDIMEAYIAAASELLNQNIKKGPVKS